MAPQKQIEASLPGAMDFNMSKTDSVASQLAMERQIGGALFGVALVLYLASMSWTSFPGLPTRALLLHLGLEPAPGAQDLLWGWLVRFFARLPGLSVAGWTGLFSAVCGACSVGLMGRLMVRVVYRGRAGLAEKSMRREVAARRISGLVSGLYLAVCIPFWVVSTRSLPGAFHVLLLLAAVWFFSEYQRAGKLKHLGLLGLLYGIGITEFATCIVYLPLVLFLVAREMARWRALRAWRPQLVVWGGLWLGLSLYPIHAEILFRQAAASGLFASPWQAWARILQEQALLITQMRYSPGFPVIMFFSMVPWLMLFAMSRRSPWFYEGDQVVMRLIFVGGLLAVLYNAPFAPWKMLGMSYLMVTPYLLLAVCLGYMAGEFWILGEFQMKDSSLPKRIVRRVFGVFALALSLAVLAGGVHNWRVVDGRPGDVMMDAAKEILDRLDGRDILFSTGPFDESLRMAVWERQMPVRVISAPLTTSPLYLQRLAHAFKEDALKQPLLRGDFGAFLDTLLMSDDGPRRAGIIDMPDVFYEFGYLVPDGFLYRIETSAARIDLPALIESQRPFWDRMEQMARHPVPEANLVRLYQDMLRLLASKVANNLGVMQAEHGDEEGALETFRTARRIYPKNLSVLLNLIELGRTRELPEAAELELDWTGLHDRLGGERWALGIRFGYVWHAHEWVHRGWVWVLSGAPASAEAARRNPSVGEDGTDERTRFLDQAYLQWGTPLRDETYYQSLLMQDEKNTSALMAMCQLALRRNDQEVAAAYMTEAMAKGLSEEGVLFDRAMATWVRGEKDQAVKLLGELARLTPGDARVWMALVLLSDENDPLGEKAMKMVAGQGSAGIEARLALAWVHLSRQQWSLAQEELVQAIQIDPRNIKAWEMMVTLAQVRDDPVAFGTSLRTLLAQDPSHPLRHMDMANALYQRGAWAEAAAELRTGLQRGRNPDLLNGLAHIIMKQDGDLKEVRSLLEEALRKQPFNPIFQCTRSELNFKEGRYEEAERDLRQVLAAMPGNTQALLLSAQLAVARGEISSAIELVRPLARRQRELSREQRIQLKKLLEAMRKP
jgi:Tfp pilus assembly protein PilF